MRNFLFLGFAIPDKEMNEIFKADSFPAIQTQKFIWNVIKAIEYQKKINCVYISAKPVSDYPFFKEKKIKKEIFEEVVLGKKIKINSIPFINSSLLKILTRFTGSLICSIKNYSFIKDKRGVIVYSVHIPFMLTGLIVSKIYKIPYIAIWTDPPAIISNRESIVKTKLRNIELKLSKILMKRADKIIALTKFLAEDFAPEKPYLVIEGIVDAKEFEEKKIEIKEEKKAIKILYTGSLEKRYGIKNIVEGLLMLKNQDVILEIYGKGDYEEELIEISKNNKNVKYNGFVENKKILELQKQASYLINARSSEEEYVKYSFPSKTLEYMLSGTPLISTMLPGIPEEYKEYFYILENNSPKMISKKIRELIKLTNEERIEFGRKAQKFALTKNYENQGRKIMEFIL